MTNPLLEEFNLPPFSSIHTQHIEAAVDACLAACRQAIAQVLAQPGPWTWDSLVQPIEQQDEKLAQIWSPVSHFHAVKNSPELRQVFERCLPKLSDYHTEVGQNTKLYQAYESFSNSAQAQDLDAVQKRIIDHTLRDFRLAGVSLDPAKKQRYKAIQQALSQLGTEFDNHILDATDNWSFYTEDLGLLRGLPAHTLDAAQSRAKQAGQSGWKLGLDFPTYHAVMTYAQHRPLRQEFYTAYVTRASDQGPHAGKWDNSKIMQEILALRHEEANLLGFANYAELSLATKMAPSSSAVFEFLQDLAARSKPIAEQELNDLQAFAKKQGLTESLAAWDIAYYSEKLRESAYGLSEEALRAYFPIDQVLNGLFAILQKIYRLRVSSRQVDTWHESVEFFDIADEDGSLRGSFYMDLYARANKRGGAWMDDYLTRHRLADGSIQAPVAYLTCNFTPPLAGQPAYLSHDEVITLFHEMGHVLHHLLSKVDYRAASGIHGVEWDAVELPSQFMENFCWTEEGLKLLSKHKDTQQGLPADLFERLLKSRRFQAGLQMLRQIEFALFDFHLHADYDPQQPQPVQAVLERIRQQVAVIQPPAFNRFAHGFSHIFAGGYAAGYYSYKWAEVLSADAFSKFEQEGVLNAQVGQAFLQQVLEAGSSKDALELFIAFRGRPPSIEALLRHNGIN